MLFDDALRNHQAKSDGRFSIDLFGMMPGDSDLGVVCGGCA